MPPTVIRAGRTARGRAPRRTGVHGPSPTVSLLLVPLLLLASACAAGEREAARTPVAEVSSVPSAPSDWDLRFADLPRAEVLLGGTSDADAVLRIAAVVADTPEMSARGLQGVSAVPDGSGMLFVLPGRAEVAQDRPGFWMLDTLVPLDIAFAADGVVVGVATMQPCPGPPCPVTHPGVPYDVAVEVAAGVLAAAAIGPGDRLEVRRTAAASEGGAG